MARADHFLGRTPPYFWREFRVQYLFIAFAIIICGVFGAYAPVKVESERRGNEEKSAEFVQEVTDSGAPVLVALKTGGGAGIPVAPFDSERVTSVELPVIKISFPPLPPLNLPPDPRSIWCADPSPPSFL